MLNYIQKTDMNLNFLTEMRKFLTEFKKSEQMFRL